MLDVRFLIWAVSVCAGLNVEPVSKQTVCARTVVAQSTPRCSIVQVLLMLLCWPVNGEPLRRAVKSGLVPMRVDFLEELFVHSDTSLN